MIVHAHYNQPVRFSLHEPLSFTDFDLRFIGTRREVFEKYPRGFLYYDFELTHRDAKQTLAWTAGTGLIEPLSFEINAKRFELWLGFAETPNATGQQKLEMDELLITQN